MAQNSMGFVTSGVGDGTLTGYTAAQWQHLFRKLLCGNVATEGVLFGIDGQLAVTDAGGGVLAIASGEGFPYGVYYWSTAVENLTPFVPVINTTGWRVVLRVSWGATQTVRLALLQSADGVAAPPVVTQIANTTWEISLAYGTIDILAALVVNQDVNQFHTGNLCLLANAYGRQGIGDGFFNVATVLAKFAAGCLTEANLLSLIPADAVTNAVLLDAVLDGAFQNDAATRALFADGIWTAAKIANRARLFFVPCTAAYNQTDGTALTAADYVANCGWTLPDGKIVHCYGQFAVPQDFDSAMEVVAVVVTNVAGNCFSQLAAYYGAIDQLNTTHSDVPVFAAEALAAGLLREQGAAPLSLTNEANGDLVDVRFSRDAIDANDTIVGAVSFWGFVVTYMADS